MEIYLVSPGLVALEAEKSESREAEDMERRVAEALEDEGLEPWGSLELEEFTYRGRSLIFARPIRVFVPDFSRLFR